MLNFCLSTDAANCLRERPAHRKRQPLQRVQVQVCKRSAAKSLARTGRKQATATKLGIYSTHSPRSSTHFLARCSNICKTLKKKIKKLSVQPSLRGSNNLRVGRKMATFQLFFQSKDQVVVRRGQIRRIGWVIKTLEAKVGQFLLGCKCLVSRDVVVQEQDRLGEFPSAFFLQNIFQLHQQGWVIIRVDSLALWKIINEEDVVLIPQKSRWELFQQTFALGIFPMIVALSPGHRNITSFVHDHQSQ